MSDDRKRPSGHQQRVAKREREAAERAAEAERLRLGASPLPPHLQRYAEIPPAPIGDTRAATVRLCGALQVAADNLIEDFTVTEAERERRLVALSKARSGLLKPALDAEVILDIQQKMQKKGKGAANDPKRTGSSTEPYTPSKPKGDA